MATLLEGIQPASVGARRVVSVDMHRPLQSDILSGTPTVTELGIITSYDDDGVPVYTASTDLSIVNKSRNSATIPVMGHNVIANQAVQFKVSGQQSGNVYLIRVSCATVAEETLVYDVRIAGQ